MLAIGWSGIKTLQRDWLETGFLALLPTAEQRPDVAQAIDQQNRHINRKLIWLSGAATSQQALASAKELKRQIEDSGLFERLLLDMPREQYQQKYQRLFPYRYQLLDAATRQILRDDPQRLAKDNLALLYSPVGQMQAAGLERDPWLLFGRYFRSRQAMQLNLEQGIVVLHDKDRFWALLIGDLHDQQLKLDKLDTLLSISENARRDIQEQGGELLATGMPLFTAYGSRSAQQEISVIGIGSTVGVVVLLLMTFRSPWPLLLSCLAVAAGLLAAWVLSLQLFGKLHILTLVFGSSLIGVVVDYALHFFCDGIGLRHWTPRQGLRYVLPGIAFGLLTSLLGYAGLGLSPFPGLREIAVFSAIGLIVSWLTVVGLFPYLLAGFRLEHQPRVLKLTTYWQQHWPAWLMRHPLLLSLLLFIVIVGGLLQLQPRDDIRLLQSAPAELLATDAKIKQLLSISRDSQFFLVSGKDEAEWYRNERRLLASLDPLKQQDQLSRYDAISHDWSSVEQQQENYRLLQATIYQPDALQNYMGQLGFSVDAHAKELERFAASANQVLTLADWLASADEAKQNLWLGCDEQGCRSTVALSGVTDSKTMAVLQALPGVIWVDHVGQLSDLFQRYRHRVTYLLFGVCGLLLATLIWKLGWRNGVRVMAVPGLAMLTALAVLGWRGELFTLFNLFALLLVLEIAVDYAIFFQMADDAAASDKRDSTSLAVTLSAFTTLLAYGLLAMSSTAIVHAFGVTLAAGILTAFLLAPLVGFTSQRSDKETERRTMSQ